MTYRLQHNGNGKTHLINDDLEALCRIKDIGNFSPVQSLAVENGIFYELWERTYSNLDYKQQVSHPEVEYCIKCLNKALKINNGTQTTNE